MEYIYGVSREDTEHQKVCPLMDIGGWQVTTGSEYTRAGQRLQRHRLQGQLLICLKNHSLLGYPQDRRLLLPCLDSLKMHGFRHIGGSSAVHHKMLYSFHLSVNLQEMPLILVYLALFQLWTDWSTITKKLLNISWPGEPENICTGPKSLKHGVKANFLTLA